MEFVDFVGLTSEAVTEIVSKTSQPLGVAIPFNGTRRWYLATFHKTPDQLYTQDYLDQVCFRMLEIIGMMFRDGVHTLYTPIIGRDLIQRGAEYMRFGAQAVATIGGNNALSWCLANQVGTTCYGEPTLLPADVQATLNTLRQKTQTSQARHYLCYGVFADRWVPDILARTVQLYKETGAVPTEEQLITSYYGGSVAPVALWIGSDQPTVFDVPLVIHTNTALYFLQYPTPYLDHRGWRRLLYDYLFVRGDQETLYPDNITSELHIAGLGVRKGGYWVPSLD